MDQRETWKRIQRMARAADQANDWERYELCIAALACDADAWARCLELLKAEERESAERKVQDEAD